MQALLYTPFSGKKAFPPRSAGPGGFLRLLAEKPLRHACGVPPPLSRGGLGSPQSFVFNWKLSLFVKGLHPDEFPLIMYNFFEM